MSGAGPTGTTAKWGTDNTEPARKVPMPKRPHTIADYGPVLEALDLITLTSPGLPAAGVYPGVYHDTGGHESHSLDVTVDSLDDLHLWLSAVHGAVRADLPAEHHTDGRTTHRVLAIVGDVTVEVTHTVPAGVAA